MDTNTFVFRGAAAELRWGYHQAAALTNWELQNGKATAHVVSLDDFKVSQRPLMFVVHSPSGQRWTWPVTSLQIAGATVSMALAEE